MTDEPIEIDLETEEEIDWFKYGRKRGAEVAVRELNARGEKPLIQGVHVEGADADEIDEAHDRFTSAVNMTATELREWADHECSDKASINPQEVRQRVLNLLETPKDDWGDATVSDANQVVSFISRMRGVQQGGGTEDCPSDRDISLMNWGYRPSGVDL
jgi:hypothetical protein